MCQHLSCYFKKKNLHNNTTMMMLTMIQFTIHKIISQTSYISVIISICKPHAVLFYFWLDIRINDGIVILTFSDEDDDDN